MTYTWKVVYHLPPAKQSGGMLGVAFVEAATQSEASFAFQRLYEGQFHTIKKIEKMG